MIHTQRPELIDGCFMPIDLVLKMIPGEDNNIWSQFKEQVRAEAIVAINKLGDDVTEEAIDDKMLEYVEDQKHLPGLMKYLHIFKCGSCPELHYTELDVFVVWAEVDMAEFETTHRLIMRNIIFAFPMRNSRGTALYTMKHFDEMAVMTKQQDQESGEENSESYIWLDPEMTDMFSAGVDKSLNAH